MWTDVQKGCGMGLGGYADLRVLSLVQHYPCTPCTLSWHTILAIVCSLNLDLSGDLGGTAHYAHHFISLIYEIIKIPHVYISHWKNGAAWRAGRRYSIGKCSKREKNKKNSLHTSMKNGVQRSVQGVPKVCSARRNGTPFPWRTSSASDFFRGRERTFLN